MIDAPAAAPTQQGWRADFAATPPFHHLAALAARLDPENWPTLARLDALAAAQGLLNDAGLPVRFAAQYVRCGQWDYEAAILAGGQVPSRERNWHDLLNALTWLAFPRAKAALNAVQCAELERRRGTTRGAVSDAATLFDESGLLLVAPDDALAELLSTRQWHEAFVARRALWAHARVYAFGHAVLEKLLAPWPGITAKCLFLRLGACRTLGSDSENRPRRGQFLPDSPPHIPAMGQEAGEKWTGAVGLQPEIPKSGRLLDAPLEAGPPPAALDAALAAYWRDGRVSRPAALFPVPVLGIPGWWPANADPAFYQDVGVFRPLRIM